MVAMEENKPDPTIELSYRVLVREGILGFIFWSLYQALPPMIWFYPLNELEISGYEAFAVVLISPILTVAGPLRKAVQTKWGLAFFRMIAVICIGSFQAHDTLSRLVILSVGCFSVMLVLVGTLWSTNSYQRTITFWGLVLGLFGFLVSRIWFISFVPTWWSMQTNSTVMALGVIATLDKIKSGEDAKPPTLPESTHRPNWVLTAIGFSSLLYVTTGIFGEVSLITRWSVKGFPNTGPMPVPWGGLVLIYLHAGILIGSNKLACSWVWWALGACSLNVLLHFDTWTAFFGGLGVAIYIMSIWPEMIDRLTACPPAKTLALTSGLHVAQILFSVWCTAYNFVPGGEYTREHTDWQIYFIAVTLALALKSSSREEKQQSNTAFVHKMPGNKVHALLLILTLTGISGIAMRYRPHDFNPPQKVHPKADFTAAIWTYHFGYDNQGWPSLERSAELLNNTGADVITLLESDASKPFLGNNDLGTWLGEKLDMYVDFGPSTKDHTWGNLILSKYPIVKSTHHLLPSPHGELAPAITATINMTGHLVDFVVVHMGNDRDVLDRELQAKFLAKELREAENPAVFLGYVTSRPGSRDYRELVKKGKAKDIDETDKERWCEYILYKGLIRLGYARVSHGGLSDTEVQMARFRIPEDPNNYKDNTKIEKNPDKIDKNTRFSSKFGDYADSHNWIRSHQYHMSTPKYFTP